MLPETAKPAADGSTKGIDREVRDMVNAITHRVTALSHHHKTAGGGGQEEEEEDRHHHHHQVEAENGGARIITLAGTNTGATMRSEFQDMFRAKSGGNEDDEEEEEDDAGTNVGTFVNSNFQAVNNSIMFESNYSTNDPGVHLHISETFENQAHNNRKQQQHGIKKGRRHEKETSHGEQEQSHHQYSE